MRLPWRIREVGLTTAARGGLTPTPDRRRRGGPTHLSASTGASVAICASTIPSSQPRALNMCNADSCSLCRTNGATPYRRSRSHPDRSRKTPSRTAETRHETGRDRGGGTAAERIMAGGPFFRSRNSRGNGSLAFANNAISTQPCPPARTVHNAMISRVWKSCSAALPVLGSSRPWKQAANRFVVASRVGLTPKGVESIGIESGKHFCHRQVNPKCGSPAPHNDISWLRCQNRPSETESGGGRVTGAASVLRVAVIRPVQRTA